MADSSLTEGRLVVPGDPDPMAAAPTLIAVARGHGVGTDTVLVPLAQVRWAVTQPERHAARKGFRLGATADAAIAGLAVVALPAIGPFVGFVSLFGPQA